MYKVSAVHKCQAHLIINRSAMTVSALALTMVVASGSEFTNVWQILGFALLNSTFFGLGSIAKIKSLERISSSLAFPVTKLNALFLIIYALVLFNEMPNVYQWIGIGISMTMLAYISLNIKDKSNSASETPDPKKQLWGLGFALMAAFGTSLSMLTGKFASTQVPKLNYIFFSYSMLMVTTAILNRTVYKAKSRSEDRQVKKKTNLFGFVIGILSFVGYYLVLSAFEKGPLSVIQGISSNSFVIPIVLSIIIFREKLNYKKAIVVLLAVLSIVLLKLEP